MGQFSALMTKNWILYRRGWISALIQFLVPLLFICFVRMARNKIQATEYGDQSYLKSDLHAGTYGMAELYKATKTVFLHKQCGQQAVALGPAGDPMALRLNKYLTGLGMHTEMFNNDEEINSRVRDPNYGHEMPGFCYAVTFQNEPGKYHYNLRFNISQSFVNHTEGPQTQVKNTLDKAVDMFTYRKTIFAGMHQVNIIVLNQILLQQMKTSVVVQNKMAPISQEAYTDDPIFNYLEKTVSVIFLLPLLIVYLRQTSQMLSEKQKKIRETMSIMGMKTGIYYSTWFARYILVYFFIHIFGSIVVVKSFPTLHYGMVLTLFLLFDILLIVQSFFIQVFFSRARIGVLLALLFFVVQFVISFLIGNSDSPTRRVNTIISAIPHIAFILGFQTMLYADSVRLNLCWNTETYDYTVNTATTMIIMNIFLWGVLTWYLEQVFPNEWGSKKHPLFFLFDAKDQSQFISKRDSGDGDNSDMEEVESKFKQMQGNNQLVRISKLMKVFGSSDTLAVDDLNVNIYTDQIFVLLGHNGAGKTTTISMLTGMIKPSSGVIQILGEPNILKARQKIGICPQCDTVYDQLTVEEHLRLFGTFRGLSKQQSLSQGNKLITDVNLDEKRHCLSKDLSGGQRRRLSVAIAFSGKSKVVILDEPTSGMDTSARRYIWELLKSYKKDKIILLTTHFMDEADYLGDRIGIMGKGKLLCCGSSIFLKNRFGVGYNITFVKASSETSTKPILSLARKHLQGIEILSDVSAELALQLPLEEVRRFSNFFKEVDDNMDRLGILSYGISITTLEQVFLKVAQERQTASKNKLKSKSNTAASKLPVMSDLSQMPRIRNQTQKIILHTKATLVKRLRVIKRDINSFVVELLLPMGVILFALALMKVSFMSDSPKRQVSINTFLNDDSPIILPISGTDMGLVEDMKFKLFNRYRSDIQIVNAFKPNKTNLLTDFDQLTLFPLKKQSFYTRGGIYFERPRRVGATRVYPYTTLVNTRSANTILWLPIVGAEAYLNYVSKVDEGQRRCKRKNQYYKLQGFQKHYKQWDYLISLTPLNNPII